MVTHNGSITTSDPSHISCYISMFKTRKKVKESSNFIAAYKCKIWFRTPKKATTQTSRKCLRLKYSVEYLDLSDREGGGE